MSNYATADDSYLLAIAHYYGSIEQTAEELAIARGFVTRNGTVSINKLSDASGISRATLWYLFRGKKAFRSMNLVTLSKLCHALNAQPGDLLQYVPGGSERGLGYSSDAFTNLRGTQNRGGAFTFDSESAGDESGEERPALSES